MPRQPIHTEGARRVAKLAAKLSKKGRWGREEATALIKCWRQSGLSRAGFAKQHDLPPHRLKYWSDRMEPHPEVAPVEQEMNPVLTLHPVRLSPPDQAFQPMDRPASAIIEIVTPSGLRIRLGPDFNAETLRQVLGVVEC